MSNLAQKTEISMPVWKHPEYYFGFSPDGDYLLYARNRDSDILTNSNFECLQKYFEEFIKKEKIKPSRKPRIDNRGEEMPSDWIYAWSASCWAHGWREYLMVRKDAPVKLLEKANEVYDFLMNCYPVFDEDDYSQRQEDAIQEYWSSMSIKERMYYCNKAECSIFAARHPYPNSELRDYFYNYGDFS